MSVAPGQGVVSRRTHLDPSAELTLNGDSPKDVDYSVHRMILGTHTSNQAGDQLIIAEVLLPKSVPDMNATELADLFDEERHG